ncbi:hypothetical protein RHMOL_Rhmol06G0292200 [Rhododendron molle]|uniref:Uncharacterized protein n=1 Tax=Rhododendron molle TaxID=49168 RepID=A0ACC0NJU6_RHOML|nr:hypothetical protein RHMOL_Rhmol06G0292200 [Rhododendron molle]
MEPDAHRIAQGDRGDRLSALPVELALNIIGRLAMKSAVAVVVCVKKWYDTGLWAQVEDVDFNLRVDVIVGWISEAVRLGAAEIQLDYSETVRLPESLLLSTTVHTLRLHSHVSIPLALPENMFTGLRTLRMQNHFDDMDFLGANLFRRIPSLHELYLDGSVSENALVTIQIVLPQLERLELRLVSHGDLVAEMVNDEMGECRVILDAPRLMYVSLHSDFEVSFEVVDSPIVVTAQLRLGVCARGVLVFVDEEFGVEEDHEIEEEEGYAWSVFNLLSRLRNVQTLFLSTPTRYVSSL